MLDVARGLFGLRSGAGLKVGDRAPDFNLRDSDGRLVSLAATLAGGPVVLAFYPRAFTSGCTAELRGYTQQHDKLTARGARLLAISVDDPPTLARFKASLAAPFVFHSDPDGAVSTQNVGLTGGKANRMTFTVAQDGTITRITAGVPALFPSRDIAACPAAQPASR
jgi:peroxiredoxin